VGGGRGTELSSHNHRKESREVPIKIGELRGGRGGGGVRGPPQSVVHWGGWSTGTFWISQKEEKIRQTSTTPIRAINQNSHVGLVSGDKRDLRGSELEGEVEEVSLAGPRLPRKNLPRIKRDGFWA